MSAEEYRTWLRAIPDGEEYEWPGANARSRFGGAVERLETHFPNGDNAPTIARAFLRAALETWRLDGFGEVTELLTSELVTNVVRHVGAPMTVRLLLDDEWRLRVEVDDPSRDLPVLEHPGPDDEHGRGILFVDTLADEWGTETRGDAGKTVWFELDVSTATAEIHGTE